MVRQDIENVLENSQKTALELLTLLAVLPLKVLV
jgi:hypothetical protein